MLFRSSLRLHDEYKKLQVRPPERNLPGGGVIYASSAMREALEKLRKVADLDMGVLITGESGVGKNVAARLLHHTGGSMAHNGTSGCAHFSADSEDECITQIRQLLGFLPQNNMDPVPVYGCGDDLNREDSSLNDIVPENPNKPYDMMEIIRTLADNGEVMEIGRAHV